MREQSYQGQRSWVVKDPLSLQYYRLREEEFAIWNLLDGSATLGSIKRDIERQFRPRKITFRQIESLLSLLQQRELVIAETAGRGTSLQKRQREGRYRRTVAWWMNPLAIRLPGFDPEPLLRAVYPSIRWCFSWPALAACWLLMLTASLLIVVQFDAFQARLPAFGEFFRGENVILFLVAIGLSKIVHELGHAFACKHFGGECHEIGPMLLVFTPALYCDTSDSWMLASRWQRAAVGAAGMFAELVLASLCTLVWWNTQLGPLHYGCLAIMFVSSVSTLLFNVNPLLRYDGYYILSDLLEIPNLAARARAALTGLAQRWFLSQRRRMEPLFPRKHAGAFALYAVAATVYRYVVLAMIFWFLAKMLQPHGLQVIGHALLAVTVIGMLLAPLRSAANYVSTPGSLGRLRAGRISFTLLISMAIMAAILFVPLPRSTLVPASIQPRGAERVYVRAGGILTEVLVEPGDHVAAGDPLARVANPELMLRRADLAGKLERLQIRLRNLKRQQGQDPTADQQLPHVATALADLVDQRESLDREIDALTLRATQAGVVIAPPSRNEETAADDLSFWSGSALDRENLHCRLETGDLFCLIAAPSDWEAVLAVAQSDLGEVHAKQAVTIRLDQYASASLTGEITRLAENQIADRSDASNVDPLLAQAVARWQHDDGMPPPYLASVPLDHVEQRLLPGFTGEAKIRLRNRSLGQRAWRYLIETVRYR